jgi:alpha-L-arabinofuranosidase
LVNYSKYYRTFSNVLTVRTITGEYLVAMKLMAYRQYKHDISDIVGILREQQNSGDPLTLERIDKAVKDLYDNWDNLPENAKNMIESILANEDMDALYEAYANEEAAAKDALITFEDKYPDVLKEDNLADILNHLLKEQNAEE